MFEIMRRDPFASRSIRDLMNFVSHEPFFRATGEESTEEGTLAVDVAENDGDIVVRASLPGFDKKDIDVQVHNGVLSIKAEHAEESEEQDEKFYRRERYFGSVSRRIALPGIVADAEAHAELKEGVLTVRIPQQDVARPKQISIK